MIELTQEQARAVEQAEQIPIVLNPRTRQEFVLLPRDRYESIKKWMGSLGRNWDSPADDDLIARPSRRDADSLSRRA